MSNTSHFIFTYRFFADTGMEECEELTESVPISVTLGCENTEA